MVNQTKGVWVKFAGIGRFILTAICALLLGSAQLSQATTIDFGTSWPVFTGVDAGNYANTPYDRVLGVDSGTHSTEAIIADFVNDTIGTSFDATDINKFGAPAELGGEDGYFLVPVGWTYLVVQYDGPHGGSILVDLGGNDAIVPYDSSAIWGSGDKYAVSHYSLIGPTTPPTPTSTAVPDGGATVLLLGCAFMGLAVFRRALVKA